MIITAARIELYLDRLALVATHCTPEQNRKLLLIVRRLERELEQLRTEDDELAALAARLQRPGALERLAQAQAAP